jgi:hypothetical protein
MIPVFAGAALSYHCALPFQLDDSFDGQQPEPELDADAVAEFETAEFELLMQEPPHGS